MSLCPYQYIDLDLDFDRDLDLHLPCSTSLVRVRLTFPIAFPFAFEFTCTCCRRPLPFFLPVRHLYPHLQAYPSTSIVFLLSILVFFCLVSAVGSRTFCVPPG